MSNSEDDVLKLVGMTYDAALDETKWPSFLEAFAHTAGSKSAILRSVDYQIKRASFSASVGYDHTWREAYANHYVNMDYFANFFKTGAINSVGRNQNSQLVGLSLSEQRKTEYHNEYHKLIDVEYSMATILARDGNQVLQFSRTQRNKRAGEFSEEQARLMSILSPHVTRAVLVHRKISSVTVEKEWALSALDQLRMSVILTNSSGTPMFINRAAEQMLTRGDGINTHHGRFILSNPAETARLYKLIDDAATGAPGKNRGGDLRIALHGGDFLHCSVIPIPLEFTARWNISLASGCVAVFISRPSGLQLSPKRLTELYGLTPAEGRLASRLAALRNMEQAADDLGISINTARTQIKSVFGKTGTRSQSELIMLLATGTVAQCHDE